MPLLQSDLNKIKADFAAQYDRSFFDQKLLHESWSKGAGTFLGEGTHFRAWLCKCPNGASLVLKVAKPDFFAFRGQARDEWVKAWKSAERAGLPLVPPFATHEINGGLAIVMPYAGLNQKKVASPWQPLGIHLDNLHRGLKNLGLELRGVIQVACQSQGIPIVIDWSDLHGVDR